MEQCQKSVNNLWNSLAYGGDTEYSVEEIGLFTRLGSSAVSSLSSSGASGLGSIISLATVHESVADEAGDDTDSLGRTVRVGREIGGLECGLPTVIEPSGKVNRRDRAAAKVTDVGATSCYRNGSSAGSIGRNTDADRVRRCGLSSSRNCDGYLNLSS